MLKFNNVHTSENHVHELPGNNIPIYPILSICGDIIMHVPVAKCYCLMFTYFIRKYLLLSVIVFFDCNYYYYITYFTYFVLDYEINYRIGFKDSVIYSIKKILRNQKPKDR